MKRLYCIGLTALGCNPYPRWPRFDSGPLDTAITVEEEDRPRLEVTPTNLDFGEVERGGTTALVVKLISTGNTVTVVRDLKLLANDDFSLELPEPDPFLIPPGEVADLRVRFAPTTLNDYEGSLFIDSDGLTGSFTLGIRGTGIDP